MNLQDRESCEAHFLRSGSVVWIDRVIGLLDVASRELSSRSENAHRAIVLATSLLREQLARAPERPSPSTHGGLLAWQVRKLLDYIDGHMEGQLLVCELSAVVQLSGAHFSRLFRRTFQQPPHIYLVRCRLERAKQLMLGSSTSLSDIALQCGFSDQAHLCRRFRQVIGESPAAWRRAMRGQSPVLRP